MWARYCIKLLFIGVCLDRDSQPGKRAQIAKYAVTCMWPILYFIKMCASAQEDIFLPNITAWESITFYTQLSVPFSLDKASRRERMDAVMETMGLQTVKNTMVCPP